jgi:hypothetical protein
MYHIRKFSEESESAVLYKKGQLQVSKKEGGGIIVNAWIKYMLIRSALRV